MAIKNVHRFEFVVSLWSIPSTPVPHPLLIQCALCDIQIGVKWSPLTSALTATPSALHPHSKSLWLCLSPSIITIISRVYLQRCVGVGFFHAHVRFSRVKRIVTDSISRQFPSQKKKKRTTTTTKTKKARESGSPAPIQSPPFILVNSVTFTALSGKTPVTKSTNNDSQ